MQLPKARTADILEQVAGDELMIYDLRIDKAYVLNKTSAIVYKACGKLTLDELKNRHKFSADLIHLALSELQKNSLLETDYNSPFADVSRRKVIRNVGLATMVALPVISSLIVPTAANAASGSLCAQSGGNCIAQNQNLCAGSLGSVSVRNFSSTNGSCTGTLQSGPYTVICSAGRDIRGISDRCVN